MHKWVSAVLVMALLAGCAEETKETVDEAEDGMDTVAADALPFSIVLADANLTLEGLVLQEGDALNFTISTAANVTAVSWFVESLAEQQANVTANATAPEGANATANATANASAEPVVLASGSQLPANVSIVPPAGNQTLIIRASAEGYSEHVQEYAIRVVSAAGDLVEDVVEVDPCLDAAVQEPLSDGTMILANADGALGTEVFTIPVLACQTAMTFTWSYEPTCYDLDMYLSDPSGAAAGSLTSFNYPEAALVAKGKPHLMEGDWELEVVPFATVACNFEFTVTFG